MLRCCCNFFRSESKTVVDDQDVTTTEPQAGPPEYASGEVKVSGRLR